MTVTAPSGNRSNNQTGTGGPRESLPPGFSTDPDIVSPLLTASQEEGDGPEHYSFSYFYRGRTLSIILLGLLYLLLALSLDAAGWVDDMSLLVPVVLGAMTMGTLMAFSRFDGLFMISHSLSTGLAWVFFLMTRLVGDESRVAIFREHGVPELQARAYFLLERWLEWVQTALSGSASNDNYVFILEISFLIWWLTYLGAWTVLRHGFVWRGVILAGVALLVNTYYAPEPVTGIMVVFFITSILLLAWTNLVSHQQRWQALRIRFNQEITLDFMRDGAFYALVVISLAFVAPSLGRNPAFNQALEPFNQRWESATTEWNRLYQGINRQTRPGQGGFGRTLTLGGERNVSAQPVLQVQAATGRYWRAVAFDTFTGRQWINTAEIEAEYDSGELITNPLWQSRRPLTQTVRLLAPIGSVIVGAPDIQQASIPLEGLVSPIFSAPNLNLAGEPEITAVEGEFTWGRSRIPLDEGESYQVVSNYTEVTEREMRESGTDYPEVIRQRYLQLPEAVSPRVVSLAQEMAGSQATVFDQVKALERFLRTFTYDEEIPAPGQDVDPVEYFLFDIQRGYCDYYATAMAVMLRTLGIPARTASGYAEGSYDQETDSYIITERDAHTWVEVYFPGYGWIEFEPTAGESVLARPSGIDLNADNTQDDLDRGLPDGQDQPQMDDGLQPQMDDLSQFDPPFFGEGGTIDIETPGTWIGFSVLLTIGALLAGWWLMRRRGYAGPDDFEAAPANIFYLRLSDWGQRLGLMGSTGQTPYERASVLGNHLPAARGLIQRITDIYVHYRYAPRHGEQSADETELDESWRQLRPILWKAWIQKRVGQVREAVTGKKKVREQEIGE